jgi:3-hydroxyisobutyrate dehydrogenase/2-hydroxy-3-oxopropionate reductase
MIAIADAIVLAEALGIDAALLPDAFAGGFADSRPLQIFGPRMAAEVDPGPRVGAIATLYKDVAAVIAAADAAGLPLPLLRQVAARYRGLIDAGHGGEDMPALTGRIARQ